VQNQATLVGRLPAEQRLRLDIALPLRHAEELGGLLQALADPQSPSYRHWLSVAEFTARFGPTAADYEAVLRFAAANGLQVTGTAPNRLLVNVTGSVASIERAFHLALGVYRHPTEDRTFYAPDREPTADLPVALWHVTGLDNFSLPHPLGIRQDLAGVTAHGIGSGPGGSFLASDMRAAYYGGTALTGAGQSAGLLEFLGYNESDVVAYFSNTLQTLTTSVVGVSVDGSSLSCTGSCDDTEQVIDIEMVIGMAPGLDDVYVYVSDTSDVAIFNRMATDNKAKVLACTWGWSPADPSSDDPIFQEFAAQGQSLFVASGDSGAYKSRSTDVYPADDAYVTSVGGTALTTKSAGGAWKSETCWLDSGGGISPNKIPIPGYQDGLDGVNGASKVYRNSPDVALNAQGYYACYDGTCATGWGGTSFAAPLWAGYIALADQRAAKNALSPVGFINPAIYAIGEGPDYDTDFHDITSGGSCATGYDLATGWGSPKGVNLIDALVP
jgi:subtilase family serine protease